MTKLLNWQCDKNVEITVQEGYFEALIMLDPGLDDVITMIPTGGRHSFRIGKETITIEMPPRVVPGTIKAAYDPATGILCIHARRSPAGDF